MAYDPSDSLTEWARVPVDDLGYFAAADLLVLEPSQRRQMLEMAWRTRWDVNSWRNRASSLERFMDLGRFQDRIVVDYGCGFGLDGIRYALAGAKVWSADIHPGTVKVALQNAAMFGVFPEPLITSPTPPFFADRKVDLFWAMGVLHHTPLMGDILKRMCQCLHPGGECRILLYSDKRWQQMMGEPPPRMLTCEHPCFAEFVRRCDSVGHYADWYDGPKLAKLVEDFAVVAECLYLCDDQMIGAVVKPKAKD